VKPIGCFLNSGQLKYPIALRPKTPVALRVRLKNFLLSAGLLILLPSLTLFLLRGRQGLRPQTDQAALRELSALIGSGYASRLKAVVASSDADGWYYRFELSANNADEWIELFKSWSNRRPQSMEGGEPRMSKNPPAYHVVAGPEASKIFASELLRDKPVPVWWRPMDSQDTQFLILADTDEQFSGLSRSHWFSRFELAYSLSSRTFYLQGHRPYGRYSITPASRLPPSTLTKQTTE
jgi:hypothetical protein